MPNDSHQHVVKTTSQWNERAVEYWVVPRGCLCVELTPDGKTKLKIGEGNKYYHQLPYVTDGSNLSQYYTKEEIDNLLNNFNRMAIMDTEEKESKDDLPLDGNKLGDVYLVKSQDPSTKPDPDVYLWTGSKWIYVGYDFTNIDLSHYLTKEEFHQLFDNVQEKVDIMWPKMHSHQNINVLDRIEEPYTTAEKEKLAGLRNYDSDIDHINYDIDLLMAEKHHHDNKSFLDTITEDYQIWSIADREKFDNIPDYAGVIAEIQYEIQILNEKSHTHGIDGKGTLDILNQIEEPYTTAEKEKLAGLENYSDFIGTNGMYSGTHGLVPAPSTRDVGKVLSSTGTWVSLPEITVNDFTGATDSTDGTHGLVPAPLAGEETYFLCGDGTWKEIEIPEYDAGIGLTLGTSIEHNQNTDIPEDYIQVEYLESTGTQYINLGQLAIWDYIDITIDFSITHIVNDTWISGNGNSYYGYCKGLGMLDNALRKPDTNTTYDPDILQENLRVIGFYHTDESYQNVYVFARSDSYGRAVGNSQCRIYSISTVETSSQVGGNGKKCKFFPCIRRADNVPGLYDTVSNSFFTNSGTDAFLYGPAMRVREVLPDTGNTFNVNVGEGLIVDDDNFINNDGILDITQDDAGNSNVLTIHFRDNVTKDVTIDTGVVNITQEDPNKLNELTIESSDGTTSVITIPGASYIAGTGIEIGGSIIYNRDRRIPSEIYRQVEYIESDGTGYIMTDIVPTSRTWYQFRYRGSNDSTYPTGAVFGSTAIIDGQYRDSQAFFEYYDNALKTCMMSGNSSGYGYYASSTYPSIFNHDMVVNIGNGNMNLYSVYTCEYAGNGSFRNDTRLEDVGTSNTDKDSNVQPLAIFGVNTYDITNDIRTVENRRGGRFYYLNKMEGALDDSLMTHYLRPCYRLSDERYGVYDVKNLVFYPVNDNTGFTVGNDLVDIEPVEGDVISAKIGKGLSIDPLYGKIVNAGVIDVIQDEAQQNKLTVKFINSQKDIVIPTGTGGAYTAGDGINITSDATPVIEAKLGKGLYFDTNDAIAADVYTAGQGISMSNPSGISVLNQEYYFDTQITCSLSGSFQRSFQKTTDEPALGALINVHNVGQSDSWTGPVFVGLTESSVKCTYNTDNVVGPFTYKGKTWYCTGGNYWVDGSLTDDNHNILRIPGQNQSVFPDEINNFTIAKLIIDTAGLLDNNDKVITAKLGSGLRFDSNDAIEVEPQYVRVSTTDSFVLLHTKPSDWDTDWYKYYELTYDQLPGVPPDWDPTKHYKYINDNYVLGSPGDTFVSTTWYDKHYVGLDPNTPVVFDSDVYYTGDLSLITDGENFDTAFEKVNEAIQHIERLENEVGFLKGNSVGVRTTSDPERIEFYRT